MKVTEGTMVIFKAWCYYLVAQLTPLASLLASQLALQQPCWPSWMQFDYCMLNGFIAGIIAVRAFFDGSNARWETGKNGSFHASPDPKPLPIPAPAPILDPGKPD